MKFCSVFTSIKPAYVYFVAVDCTTSMNQPSPSPPTTISHHVNHAQPHRPLPCGRPSSLALGQQTSQWTEECVPVISVYHSPPAIIQTAVRFLATDLKRHKAPATLKEVHDAAEGYIKASSDCCARGKRSLRQAANTHARGLRDAVSRAIKCKAPGIPLPTLLFCRLLPWPSSPL